MLGVLRELWQARDLALVLGWRELVVRYKRSVLGLFWALGEPLVLVGVYVTVFGVVLDAGRGLTNYSLFALQAVLAWTFFASTAEQGTHTLLDHSPILKKTYFPREVLLFAVVFSRFTTLLVGNALLMLLVLVGQRFSFDIAWHRVWALPLGFAGILALALGFTMVTSVLQVMLRDVVFLVRFGLRILFFACPIVYPVTRVPDAWRTLYDLNPLVAVLWCFQALVEPSLAHPSAIAITSATLSAVLLPTLGWAFFRRTQWAVADVL